MSNKTAAQKAQDLADKATADAAALRVKADIEADGKTTAEVKAEAAEHKADDARAAAQEVSTNDIRGSDPTPAVDAVTIPDGIDAGDHKAQVFGNIPENPAPAPGLRQTDDLVRMYRTNPNPQDNGPITADVHPEMVGDYMRAGWSKGE